MVPGQQLSAGKGRLKAILMVAIVALAALVPGWQAAAQPAMGIGVQRREASPATVQTAHYEIISEDGREMAEFIGQYMEQLFAAYTQRIGRMRNSNRRMPRLKVTVASSAASFRKLVGERLANSSGIYDPVQQRIVVRSDGPLERTLRALRHEGSHQFVSQYIRRNPPIWIDEGLAVFFEEADLCGTRLEFGNAPAARVQLLQQALKEDRLHGLEDLLAMDNGKWTEAVATDVEQSRLLYCEVWSIVHFLVLADDGAYKAGLEKYLAALARGQDAATAQREAFGADLTRFSEKWRAYIEVMKPSEAALCRRNMQLLAELLMQVCSELPEHPTAAQFRDHLLNRPAGPLIYADPRLGRVSTREPEVIRGLFRCPDDKATGEAASYSFVYGENGSSGDTSLSSGAAMARALPQIECRHHHRQWHRLAFGYDSRVRQVRYEIRIETTGSR